MSDASSIRPEILAHYRSFQERDRLSGGDGLLEKLRTQQLLERLLPKAPAVVLDVGGGPGVHALGWRGLGTPSIWSTPCRCMSSRPSKHPPWQSIPWRAQQWVIPGDCTSTMSTSTSRSYWAPSITFRIEPIGRPL